MILETFPTAAEFYATYWGKKPFIVRGYIPVDVIDALVDGDTLAGLALEDGVKSRIITNSAQGDQWACEHGPFDEDRFETLGDRDWSLLVQNVEQYDTDTAQLLPYFQLSPRWLMDDIMVSYSEAGGSVGPHTDSYHTFLVQGIGKRTWKVSDTRVDDDRYVDNPDVKVLAHGFAGETYEVTAGDVIYMPPFFGHEGKTIEPAMTFSVGFLGPRLSEILGEYALFLEEHDALNTRFLATDLGTDSAGFALAPQMRDSIKDNILTSLGSDHFARWMAAYFSMPTHEEIEDPALQDALSPEDMLAALHDGTVLSRPEHVKLALTTADNGTSYLAVFGGVMTINAGQAALIAHLNRGDDIGAHDLAEFGEQHIALKLLADLYHQNALVLQSPH